MLCLALPCLALSTSRHHNFSRRGALGAAGGAALGAALPAHAVEEEDVKVYFGAGCFWHVQHEFVEAERTILGRGDMDLTAYTGYGGGTGGSDKGKVCYHNALQVADYGKLGSARARTKHDPETRLRLSRLSYQAWADPSMTANPAICAVRRQARRGRGHDDPGFQVRPDRRGVLQALL